MIALMEKFGLYVLELPIVKRVALLGSMFLTLFGVWFICVCNVIGLI